MHKFYLLILLLPVLTQVTFAQFEKNIFEKYFYNDGGNPIYPLVTRTRMDMMILWFMTAMMRGVIFSLAAIRRIRIPSK